MPGRPIRQALPQVDWRSSTAAKPGINNPIATSQPPSAGESPDAFQNDADVIAIRQCQLVGLGINPDEGFGDMDVPACIDSGKDQDTEAGDGYE